MGTNAVEVEDLRPLAGLLGRLKEEEQAKREAERAEDLQKLKTVEARQSELGAAAAKLRAEQAGRVARLEAQLAEARAELNRANEELTGLDATATKLRGKLRKLADPRLDAAILKLQEYSEQARARFQSGTMPVRGGIFRRRSIETVSNAEPIAEIMAEARAGVAQLEALKESTRPENLDAVIASIVDPVKRSLQELAGLS